MRCRHCAKHPTGEEESCPRRRRGGVHELTVTRRYRETKWRLGGAWVPLVRMSGRWLERCGFGSGSRIFVVAEQGRLILTNFDPTPAAIERQAPIDEPKNARRSAARTQLGSVRARLRRVALQGSSLPRVHRTMAMPSTETTADAGYQ